MTNPLFQKTYKHRLDEDVVQVTEDRRPSRIRDMRTAKLILQESSKESGDCLYDHISEMLHKILDERPHNVIDYFENYSRQIREERFRMDETLFHETYIEPERLLSARRILNFMKLPPPSDFPGEQQIEPEFNEDDERRDPFVLDVMHLQFYWSLIGFGFPQSKVFHLSCAMRELEARPIVQHARFWGEIFGYERNYIICEVVLTDEEIAERVAAEEQALKVKREMEEQLIAQKDNTVPANLIPKPPPFPELLDDLPHPMRKSWPPKCPDLPHSLYEPPKDIPDEVAGVGLNRRQYFVCNHLGEDWIELPSVSIKKLNISRLIRKFLTGHLDAEIHSYPIFPGLEKDYLRCIIARITSGTYVAPVGQYRIGVGNEEEEEEEEEEEGGAKNNDKETTLDPEYNPMNLKDLLESQNWIHYRPNILKQGRVNWFNPKNLEEPVDNEEEEEEEEENTDPKYQPEIGPGLMGSCQNDATAENTQVWSVKLNHSRNHHNPVVLIRSNLWPGAVSFSTQRVHDSLYIGWGAKYVTRNYSPIPIPPIESEYPIGPEIMEMADPTVEEEDEWIAKHAKEDFDEGEGEGEALGEDEEEEDDADDY